MRQVLVGETALIRLAEAGAEFMRELFAAVTVTVSLLFDDRYHDLVNVGNLPRGEVRYPGDCRYPTAQYPESTRHLHDEGGYFTSDADDKLFTEFVATMPISDVTSIMGVSIVSGGETRGEVCLTRGARQAALDRQDFDLARDLATTFGTHLMIALDGERHG